MQFDLLPGITGYVIAFVVIAALGVLAALGVVASTLLANRKIRISRRESFWAYYGQLAHSH